MKYVDGFVVAVPADKKGCLSVLPLRAGSHCLKSLARFVLSNAGPAMYRGWQRPTVWRWKGGESGRNSEVVFSWIEYPSKRGPRRRANRSDVGPTDERVRASPCRLTA